MKDIYISIVSPVYQGEKLVERLVNEIEANVLPLTPKFEIILVDDGSTDDTTAIQDAIDDASLNGGMVVFPPGTYRVTNLTITPGTNEKTCAGRQRRW